MRAFPAIAQGRREDGRARAARRAARPQDASRTRPRCCGRRPPGLIGRQIPTSEQRRLVEEKEKVEQKKAADAEPENPYAGKPTIFDNLLGRRRRPIPTSRRSSRARSVRHDACRSRAPTGSCGSGHRQAGQSAAGCRRSAAACGRSVPPQGAGQLQHDVEPRRQQRELLAAATLTAVRFGLDRFGLKNPLPSLRFEVNSRIGP